MKIIKTIFIFSIIIGINRINAQDTKVEIINNILDSLIGDQDYTDIPKFKHINKVCSSHYFSCDKNKNVIGLNFQFANLAGTIPKTLLQLDKLEYFNFEYNYLKGTIPSGFSQLENLEQMLLAGNFLSGPIPEDIPSSVYLDLKQNSIKEPNKKLKKKFNIINQINLDGCRSPDSIFVKANQDFIPLDAVTPKNNINDSKKIVERMPMFPGCDESLDYQSKKACASNLFLQFIYGNLVYPAKDRELNMEGTAVVRFVVLRDGQIADAEIVRNPGLCLGNASLWVVNRMNYLCDRWTPGLQDDNPVKVLYTLPVKFKLQ